MASLHVVVPLSDLSSCMKSVRIMSKPGHHSSIVLCRMTTWIAFNEMILSAAKIHNMISVVHGAVRETGIDNTENGSAIRSDEEYRATGKTRVNSCLPSHRSIP